MATIFFSYSHVDEELRDKLETHLAPLKREGLISTWHDRRIGAGSDFDYEISGHLEEDDIILFLVSPEFIASDYCWDREVKRAMERHEEGSAKVIPVILRPCDWHGLMFGRLLATPTDGKPVTMFPNIDEGFSEVARAVRKVAEECRTGGPGVQGGMADGFIPPTGVEPAAELPRSSNLGIRKKFTDREKDTFLVDAFGYMGKYFQGSLLELEERYREIETNYRSVNGNRFIATIYLNGEEVSRCSIWMDDESSAFSDGIKYSYGGNSGNSWNESLSVEDDGRVLYLKPMGMSFRDVGEKLTMEGAAEYYWSMLKEHLE